MSQQLNKQPHQKAVETENELEKLENTQNENKAK